MALVRVCDRLNSQNRTAKEVSKQCDALFLALYFGARLPGETVPALVCGLRDNGLLVYVPKYSIKAAVFLRDVDGLVQVHPRALDFDRDPNASQGRGQGHKHSYRYTAEHHARYQRGLRALQRQRAKERRRQRRARGLAASGEEEDEAEKEMERGRTGQADANADDADDARYALDCDGADDDLKAGLPPTKAFAELPGCRSFPGATLQLQTIRSAGGADGDGDGNDEAQELALALPLSGSSGSSSRRVIRVLDPVLVLVSFRSALALELAGRDDRHGEQREQTEAEAEAVARAEARAKKAKAKREKEKAKADAKAKANVKGKGKGKGKGNKENRVRGRRAFNGFVAPEVERARAGWLDQQADSRARHAAMAIDRGGYDYEGHYANKEAMGLGGGAGGGSGGGGGGSGGTSASGLDRERVREYERAAQQRAQRLMAEKRSSRMAKAKKRG
eukprot:g2297.t1